MHLIQDRNQWKALVNTVTNIRVPYNLEWLSDWWLLKKDSAPWG
jgi:hypothetical protein